MVTFTLKNISETLHRQLKKQAQAHHRSLNSEMLTCLEKAAGSVTINIDSLLKRAHSMRQQISGHLTNRELRLLKDKGRA